jgi:hypothetical protein
MDFQRIISDEFVKAVLLNLETNEVIEFDRVRGNSSLSLGADYLISSLYKRGDSRFTYQGTKPLVKSFEGIIDRYWRKEDVRPARNRLQLWQKPTKGNGVPPLVAFEWGQNVFSPAVFTDLSIEESGFIKGVPTQLQIRFALTQISENSIVR